MKFLLITTYFIGVHLHQATSRHCMTPDGYSGLCSHPNLCKSVNELRSIPHHLRTIKDYLVLTYSMCTKYGKVINTICCPHHRKPKLVDVTPTPCFTPEGGVGTCKNIQLCPAAASKLFAPITQDIMLYMDTLRFKLFPLCGNMEPYSVCCEDVQIGYPKYIQNQADSSKSANYDYNFGVECTMSAQPPNLQSDCCGLHGDEERIVGGSLTGIDEYPWLVLIEYKMNQTNSVEPGCGGSLISGRYVLTASHCLTSSNLDGATPVSVRLGEYDLGNPGPDCVYTAGGGEDCTNGPLIIPIEEIILHEEYNPNDNNRFHDIALIRLSKTAPYTDFIRPICLPSFDLSLNPPADLRLYASGWGMTDNQQKISNIKRAVDLPYKPISECESVYNEINVTLWRGQICAGGEKGKDSCKGDSGGPLMYRDRQTPFTVAAIINYGAKPCGQKDVPSVYTNVYVYLQWIYDHIKP